MQSNVTLRKKIEKSFVINNLKYGMKTTELYALNSVWAENYSKYLQTNY